MKVLQINTVYGVGSTGRIAYDLARIQRENSITPYVATGMSNVSDPNVYVMSGTLYRKFTILLTRLFGRHGFYSRYATKKMLRWVDSVKPDVIHLHNIHGHYINIELLFEYIAKNNIPVIWSLHDCWSITGHCPHFDYAGCDKWKTGCGHCPQRRGYPDSWFFDRSHRSFTDKKRLFTMPENMTLVISSHWIEGLIKQSFLNKYPIKIINQGVNQEVFRPTRSDLRKTLGLEDKFVILGVVSSFSGTKGGKFFVELSRMLADDEHIVLLSLEQTDNLPKNITPLPRTDDPREIAKVYSMADVFVNPTLQDTFPMVNLEALSCGIPVVTFNTGGSPEAIDEHSGIVVDKGDAPGLYNAVQRIRNGQISKEDCIRRAGQFDGAWCFLQYTNIYREIARN